MTTTIRQQNERFLEQERKEIALSMTPAQIAAEIRQTLKREYPAWKFSVTVRYHKINVSLVEGPRPVFVSDHTVDCHGYRHPIHTIQVTDRDWVSHPYNKDSAGRSVVTDEAARIMTRVFEISTYREVDRSDYQSDYVNVNYYLTVSIGRWDKPYTIK